MIPHFPFAQQQLFLLNRQLPAPVASVSALCSSQRHNNDHNHNQNNDHNHQSQRATGPRRISREITQADTFLLGALIFIFVVSSKPLQIAQRGLGARYVCVLSVYNKNNLLVTGENRAAIRMVLDHGDVQV